MCSCPSVQQLLETCVPASNRRLCFTYILAIVLFNIYIYILAVWFPTDHLLSSTFIPKDGKGRQTLPRDEELKYIFAGFMQRRCRPEITSPSPDTPKYLRVRRH
jgi:hypothetical protein